MRIIGGIAAATILAAALSSGCTAVLVRAGDSYHPESAYIYGRFFLGTEDNTGMAFSIRCRDGKRYKIVFSKEEAEALRMIRLPAGTCQLDDVVKKGVGSYRDMAPLRLLNNEHLQPGGVYYVGDFAAAGSSTLVDTKLYGLATIRTYREQWGLNPPRNRYAETTADMKRAFPNFAAAATEDRMARQ